MIVGIDPGAYGAIAFISGGKIVAVHDMPILKIRRGKTDKAEVDSYALRGLFGGRCLIEAAYLEQVGGMTGQSASAAFNFGRACGCVEGVLKGIGLRVELVPPGTWKRALAVNPGKDGSRAMATKLWPAAAALFARKKDDGRAEAALIAEFGRRRESANAGASNGHDLFA